MFAYVRAEALLKWKSTGTKTPGGAKRIYDKPGEPYMNRPTHDTGHQKNPYPRQPRKPTRKAILDMIRSNHITAEEGEAELKKLGPLKEEKKNQTTAPTPGETDSGPQNRPIT